jgi:uncharacterized protein
VSRARDVMWSPWTGAGLEHLALACDEEGVLADGVVIGVEGGLRFRVRYEVRCDAGWRVREVSVVLLESDGTSVRLLTDREGRRTTLDGEPVPILDGCTDVDISVTPFTNTLPIRRLGLEPGEHAELEVAYVDVPGMRVEPTRQRYTCLERGEHGGLYRYEDEGLFHGFAADLPVDVDGLVLDYPGLFRRVRPNQAPA